MFGIFSGGSKCTFVPGVACSVKISHNLYFEATRRFYCVLYTCVSGFGNSGCVAGASRAGKLEEKLGGDTKRRKELRGRFVVKVIRDSVILKRKFQCWQEYIGMTSIATVSTDALSLLSLEEAKLASSHAAKWEKLYHCHREFSFSSAITQLICSELSSKSFDCSHPRPRLFRYHAKLRSRGTFDFRWCMYSIPMLVRTQRFRERRVRINFSDDGNSFTRWKSKYSESPIRASTNLCYDSRIFIFRSYSSRVASKWNSYFFVLQS